MIRNNFKESEEFMLSVLIADDELKIARLIKNLIQWKTLNLSFMGIVQDGISAYQMIMDKKPDIVITDIRMPELSGLEMIEKVTQSGLPVHFIVISGYRYFEYAQKALKYGVRDYLLKPIDEDELNRILEKICMETQNSRAMQEHVENLERNLADSRHILHRELMDRVFESGGDSLSTIYTQSSEQQSFENGVFRAFGIKADRDISIPCNEKQETLIVERITELINDTFEDQVIDLVVTPKESMWILVLLNYREEQQEVVQTLLNHLFKLTKNYICNFEHYSVSMGLSPDSGDFSQINLLLEMAREAVQCRIFEGTGLCIRSYSENRNHQIKGSDIANLQKDVFEKQISVLREDTACQIVRTCFETAVQENIMASEFFELTRTLFSIYCRTIEDLFHEAMSESLQKWTELAENCSSILELKNHVLDSLRKHIRYMVTKKSDMERRPVLDAIEYVQKNYNQKILLEEIAENSGFNANYFSELFKKETGKNFSAYVLELRMEKAKQLLRDTKKTIYEIAAEVGYKDSKYFSQQFTRTVGVKPNEYRKLYY
ncbi:MAG: response regulator [Clostridiales bacterium]|nr:response regulator [Clostridiales bacterium]